MPADSNMSNLFCVLFLKNAAVNVLSQTSDGSEWQSPKIFTGSFEQNNWFHGPLSLPKRMK